jgi:hypothetical protein
VLQDIVDDAECLPDVTEAVAARSWVGSRPVTMVHVRRGDGGEVDPALLSRVSAALDERRLVGEDVVVRGPEMVPVVVDVRVEAAMGVVPARLLHLVEARLSARDPNGFFFPGHFGFGQALYASAIVAAVMDVPGVATVTLRRLARKGDRATAPAVSDAITVNAHEIVTVHASVTVASETAR